MPKIWSGQPGTLLDVRNRQEWEKLAYKNGESCIDRYQKLIFDVISKRSPDDYCPYGNYLLVSNRLKMILERSSSKIEFLDCEIHFKRKIFQYSIFNVLEKMICIDEESSKCEYLKGHIFRVDNLVLKDGTYPPDGIFSPTKCFALIIVFGDRIARLVEEGGFSGFKLVDPEDWR